HYGQDEQTKVIVVHIESLPDPRAFLETATQVARRKPILAMKVGRTAEGAKAVSSHTGRLLKQDTAIELVFEKAGIVSFRNTEELCQAAIGFASQPVPAGNRAGMIANTGGPAIIATDELIEGGMVVPPLSRQTEVLLREKLYPEASVNNPIDVLATAGPEHFAAAIKALMNDDGIDAIFLNFVTPFFVDTLGVAREIAEANRRSHKPIVATVMTEKKSWAETLKVIRDSGVPTYDMPEAGAKVLASMGRYAALLKRPTERPVSFSDVDAARARAIIAAALARNVASPDQGCEKGFSHQRCLSADQGFDLLACYGIPVAQYRAADNVDECLAAAEEIGYPVALKVDAVSIVHKTESCGVVLDIRDRDALREQAGRVVAQFAEASPRLLVQEQLPGGTGVSPVVRHEVIVGAEAVEGLGYVVMFGLGGIYVEVLKEASFKITPVTAREARDMIESLRAYPLLSGVRGQAGVDLAALAEIIQRVSQMLVDHPEIRELDINPLFAFQHGAKAVDIRVMI
ncbi:MAG: acetate--CoA ligase family protein, partial [Phycisphaerae bacterium]